MKLFSRNLEILSPQNCDIIISNWVKRLKFVYHVQLAVKNIKIRNYNKLWFKKFLLLEGFLNFETAISTICT